MKAGRTHQRPEAGAPLVFRKYDTGKYIVISMPHLKSNVSRQLSTKSCQFSTCSLSKIGAGSGNRTRAISLGS